MSKQKRENVKKYYYVTVDRKAGYVTHKEIPSNACIITNGRCMISPPTDSWTAPAYIHSINPDARINRTVSDCVETIKNMIAESSGQ